MTAEDADGATQTNKSLFSKIFGGKGADDSKVARYLTLETKQFTKLPETTQFELSSLPNKASCLVCKPLLSMAVAFRSHCYLLLTKHEQEMTQPHLDLTMVQFPKFYNSPDFLAAMADCWPAALANANGSPFGEDRLGMLRQFVQVLFSLMFEPGVKLD